MVLQTLFTNQTNQNRIGTLMIKRLDQFVIVSSVNFASRTPQEDVNSTLTVVC